jgi:arylsulfatase
MMPSRRSSHRLRGGLIAALLLTAPWASSSAAEKPSRPNILLITADTLRPDHLGAYGYARAKTRGIDAIAKIAVRFTQAITPSPRTTPAVASLMTGLWPQHHGSREVSDPFENGTTLAQVLLANGYATYGVSANWVAGRKQNMERGFQGFVSMTRNTTRDRARFVTDTALQLLQRAPKDTPLFLWTHYMDPHFPYNPPKSYEGKPAAPTCMKMMRAVSKKRLRLAAVQGNHRGLGERTLADCRQLYDAEIAYMDGQIWRLLRGLESAGRLERVIIVFASDHGEALGEAGLFYEHGSTVHDAILRVPLLITGPDVVPGVDDEVIRLEDVMPTILSLAGLPPNQLPPTDGIDLSWRLRRAPRPKGAQQVVALAESGTALHVQTFTQPFEGQRAGKNCVNGPRFSLCTLPEKGTGLYDRLEDPMLENDVSAAHPEELAFLSAARERWQLGEARQRAARNRRYKLVEFPRLEGGYTRALYDLKADPAESRNVIEEHPDVEARLSAELGAWSASIPSNAAPPERDEEQLEMLRALGYVD